MQINRSESRKRRHERVRKKLAGSEERPRLAVYRSNKNIYAQIINDLEGKTLAAASTMDATLKAGKDGANLDGAKAVGALVAERAKAAGITKVVFDRGGYLYHGRIQALADAAREAGLEF